MNLDGSITIKDDMPVTGFVPPSTLQSVELALYKLDQANEAIGTMNANPDECEGPKFPVVRNGEETSVSVCMLTSDELKTVTTTEGGTGNDASPAVIGKFGKPTAKPKSDDVGRTFGVNARYRRENILGYDEVRLDSVSFGQRAKPNGASTTPSGNPFMKLYTVNSIEIERAERLPGGSLAVSDFRITEGSIEISQGSDKTALGTNLQTWFHKETKSGPIYAYVDHEETKMRAVLKTGFKRIIESDLGKFNCKVMATGLVGMGTDGKPVAEVRTGASINTGSMGGRSKDNPWIQLDAYRNHLVRQGTRPEEETGFRVATSAKVFGKTTVKAYLGVSRFDSATDRKYAAGSRGGRKEPYYSMGFIIER